MLSVAYFESWKRERTSTSRKGRLNIGYWIHDPRSKPRPPDAQQTFSQTVANQSTNTQQAWHTHKHSLGVTPEAQNKNLDIESIFAARIRSISILLSTSPFSTDASPHSALRRTASRTELRRLHVLRLDTYTVRDTCAWTIPGIRYRSLSTEAKGDFVKSL